MADINVQLNLKEIYNAICPACKENLLGLISSKASREDFVTNIKAELESGKKS